MKRNFFILLIIILSASTQSVVNAQQDAQYTQYMYNTMSINPAYAGSRETLSAMGLYRTQWINLEGSPKTINFNIHKPIGSKENMGAGLSIIRDEHGITSETYIDAAFSYSIKPSFESTLSFGLNVTGHLFDVNFGSNLLYEYNPEALQNINRFNPNFGAGVYYRHSDVWYLGLSVPRILNSKHFDKEEVNLVAKERMHFYLIGGYVFDLSETIKFKPAFLTKAVAGAPLQLDVSANFWFNEKFSVGAAWRWDAALSAMVGLNITDNLMIGFAYDGETTDLSGYNDGSYEVFLRFELMKNRGRILSPRFF